jgi:serine phosphatase RsbU (regulator of sigma subunit)
LEDGDRVLLFTDGIVEAKDLLTNYMDMEDK